MKFPAWFFFLSTTFVIYLWPAVAKSNPDFAHNFRWVEDFSLLLLWLARKRNDRLAPPPPPFPPLLHLQRNVLRPQERGKEEGGGGGELPAIFQEEGREGDEEE